MSITIADFISQVRADLIKEHGAPITVVCYCCSRPFECYKPLEDISDSECCGMDDCFEEQDD